MRRLLPIIAIICLAGVSATPASQPDLPHWHGIWMNGFNVLQISAGPTETVQVAAAAYEQIGSKSYLDSQFAFVTTPAGDTMNLSSTAGCSFALSFASDQIMVHQSGTCGPDGVSFDGTYTRQ